MILALIHYASMAVFAFGAMAFSWLAWSYWRERRADHAVFHVFSLVCAGALVSNLVAALFFVMHPAFEYLRDLLTGALPPLMLHLVLDRERWQVVPGRTAWRVLLGVLYFSVLTPESDSLPTLRLGLVAALALFVLVAAKRDRPAAETRHRWWNALIFAGFLVAALGSRYGESPLYDLLPDYLLLGFLAVWLYYCERLAFFDVFLKGGMYFLCGAVLVGVFVPVDSTAVVLLLAWLAGPAVLRRVSDWVDRRALRRRYSPVEAERLFAAGAQQCATEEDLRDAARRSLEEIFDAPADVWFGDFAPPPIEGELRLESVRLQPRRNGIPYLSGDKSLLESLARTLRVVRENVLFRVQQQDLREHAARAEVRALRAQINPHFLFNALNAIAGWIRVRPELADETVTQLAEVFRYALNRSQQEWVRLGEELDFVRSYLAVEQARFGDRLVVSIESDPGVESVQVPAMLIQPLVENAMKHGVSQVAAAGRLKVAVRGNREMLVVDVCDNGPGFPAEFEPVDGHGLRNVTDRLRGYYGERAGLQWENTPMGCRVRMRLPVKGHQ